MSIAIRQQALVLVALLYERDTAALFSFFPKEASTLQGIAEKWAMDPPQLRRTRLLQRLHRLERQQEAEESLLAHVHVSWFSELFGRESPGVVAVLLRLFPEQRVREILRVLPPALKAEVEEAFAQRAGLSDAISPDLLTFLKGRFAAHWGAGFPVARSPLMPLLALSLEAWIALYKKVGCEELALACYGLKKSAYLAILARLSLDDAKAIQGRILSLESKRHSGDNERLETARRHVLSLEVDRVEPQVLLTMLGMYLFSKAILSDRDWGVAMWAAYGLPKAEGHRLLSLLKRHRDLNTPQSVEAYQQRFLGALSSSRGDCE